MDRLAPRIALAAIDGPADDESADRSGEVRLLIDHLVVLHRDGTVTTRSCLVTRVFDDRSRRAWQEWSGDYDSRIAKRRVRRACVVHREGRVRGVKPRDTSAGPGRRVVRVGFGPLEPGAIVEIEEQTDQFVPFAVGAGVWDQAYLAGPVPIRRLRFTVAVAAPFEPRFALHHGAPPPQESTVDGYRVLRWDVRDQPAVPIDEWTPHLRDLAPWVDVSTLASWVPVAAFHRADIDVEHRDATPLRTLAARIVGDVTTDRDRAARIYEYAVREVGDGRDAGEHRPATRSVRRVVDELRGDCKDKAALVVGLLREVGIEAAIAVVLTSHNGRTPFLPSPRFDHAIVRARIDGGDVWMDLVAGPYTFGSLPDTDCGLPALLLDGTRTTTPTATPERHGIQRAGSLSIDFDGTLRLEATSELRGERAVTFRRTFGPLDAAGRVTEFAETLARTAPGTRTERMVFDGLDELTRDVRCEYTVAVPEWVRAVGELRLLRLPWLEPLRPRQPLVSLHPRSTPFEAPAPARIEETLSLHIPAGLRLHTRPTDRTHDCDWASYELRFVEIGSELRITRTVEFRGGIVPADRLSSFREFWETGTRADATDIVLVARDGAVSGESSGLRG